jgi:uncharacterized phage protein (TIGR01671 family)
MREIKCRGKRLDNGEWIEGDLLRMNGHWFIFPDPAPGGIDKYEVDPATVGEFTGLKDRNGKEVYEGDIIRFSNPYLIISQGKQSFGMVKYYDALAGFALYNSSEDKFPMECDWLKIDGSTKVFGNIHDNPELLKGGEK